MKYEQAMWALARALYDMKRAAENGPWDAATAIERANWRNKARQCLNGWGFDDFNGKLDARTAPATEVHAATRAAQEQYLKTLCDKYGPYVARVQYYDAVNELAAYASEVEWEKLSDAEKGQLRHRADIMLSARGFKNAGGEVAFEDKNDHFYRTVLSVLRDKHAAARIEAIARKDMSAFHGEARQLLSARAYATFGHDLLASDDGTPGHGSERVPEVGLIDDHMGESVGQTTYPTGPGGAERYDAVTAPATAVYGAEDVLARDLYEKQTPADRKHWEDLRGDHQKSYRMQAGMIPLNLPDLSETFKRQWADDVRAGRKHGAAPALKEVEQDVKTKEDRAIVASRFVDGQIGQDDAKAAGVTLSDIEQAVMRKAVSEGRKTNDRDIALNLYLKLGALAYEAVRRMYPDEMRGLGVESLGSAIATRTPLQDTHGRSMTQWKALTNDDQSRVARAAKHGWLHHTIYYVDPLLRAVAGVANTFREIAESEGMGLATFVNNARMRVVVPELTKDEAELLAWYAHESSRAEVPGIVSWNGLVPGVRERKVLAAYNYVVERMADPHITPEFFTALDAFVADAANFGRKLDKLRKARAEFSALPSNWKIAFRQ